MRFLLRQPLLHFLLLGGLLHLGLGALPQPPESLTLSGWAPGLTRQSQIDEEILLREALALHLDERDGVARSRILQNMRFAFPESSASDTELLREAQRLGMNQRDRVVRLRLVERMRQRLTQAAPLTEADLADYLARHADRYRQAARYGFEQLFFSADRKDAAPRAAAALAQLRLGQAATGDPFLLGSEMAPESESGLAQRFGAGFAAAVATAPVQQWSGPHASAYGLHLVRVTQQLPARAADAQALRAQLAYAALAEREQATLQAALVELRRRYAVEQRS